MGTRRTTVALLTGGTLLLLAGCGRPAEPPRTPGPSTSSATTAPTPSTSPPAASAAPSGEPTAPEGFAPPGTELTAEPADGRLTVVAVRTGEHDGYDRVVYELAGEGLPGWRVGYVERAVDDPSGELVDVRGDAVLQVWITGTTYPFDSGHEEFPENVLPAAGGVAEVTRPLTFEGMTQSFVGVVGEQRPVRVALLDDPVRVVVDVADAG